MKPLVLIILDGWGIAPHSYGNAITLARTPVLDKLEKEYPHTRLRASGEAVGLVKAQDGNSEAGHMNIGAGRLVEQEVSVINETIKTGAFFKNPAFRQAVKHVQKNKSRLHLMGLLSNHMSAHSYPEHLYALLKFLKNEDINDYYLHLFTDGRDSPQHLAIKLLEDLKKKYNNHSHIATIMGRYYAMERNKRWPITEQAYNALVLGEGRKVDSAEDAVIQSYNRGETDEFIKPAIINKEGIIKENDAVIFFNLRSDRARQLTKCFVQKDFNKSNPSSFKRRRAFKNVEFIAMTDFGPDLDHTLTAFPAPDLQGTLPFAFTGLKQAYVSESEKYAHVTYFFNGGYDHAVNHEHRVEIKSPDVKSYDLKPEMSAAKVTRDALIYLKEKKFDFICINYANADMVGHTGNLKAAIKGIEEVDKEVGIMVKEVKKIGGLAIITADHGNAEEMINLDTREIDTKHSTYSVPFIITKKGIQLKKGGKLGNIAPTILDLMDIKKPKEMTCHSLIC